MVDTSSYLSFFSTLSGLAPIAALSLFFLGMMRLAPIISLAPFFGSRVPPGVKVGLLVAITVIFIPHMAMVSQTIVGFNMEFSYLCVKELFIGFVLAFFFNIPFAIAESAGLNIDFLRGSASLMVTNPFEQAQTSDLG